MMIRYLISFLICGIIGVIAHFLYNLFNKNKILGAFTPVNESTFEHLKLLFFPFILVSVIETLIFKLDFINIMTYRVLHISISILMLPICYYFIKKLKLDSGLINIMLYFIMLFLAYFLSYIIEKKQLLTSLWMNINSLLLFTVVLFSFIIFTFCPPHVPLFKDPLTNTYGIVSHKSKTTSFM